MAHLPEESGMAQVSISLNGRTYRLQCGAGEDVRLGELAAMVRGKLDGLVAEFGQAGDDRLILMAALLMADELADAKARINALETLFTSMPKAADRPDEDLMLAALTKLSRRAG